MALLTKGASNLIGKNVAQAKSFSSVVSAPKLDKIAKISNAIGNITYKAAFGSSVASTAFSNLISGYIENDYFIPIRFGIKLSANSAKLYIVIDENPIKKIKVDINDVQVPQKVSADTPTSTFKASISKIFSFVNIRHTNCLPIL